jgi:hypothetical protein
MNWESFDFDPNLIPLYTAKMKGCKYKLGAKASSLDVQLSDVREIDCSGFIRLILHKCGVKFPDGSYTQGKWLEDNHFKPTTTDACKLKDGVLRIAWMLPKDGGGIGHIAFVLNGKTYESWGGHGVGSRPFTGVSKFQKVSKKFVIAYPVH